MKNNFPIRNIVLPALLLLLFTAAKAQNDPMFAHYVYHTNVFNPAVAGNTRDIHISALARQQWVGFKEAPGSQLLDAYGYIPKIRGGVGLVFMHDMLGKERALSLRLSYAYSQRLNDRAKLALGISIGFQNQSVKGDQLVYQQAGDQSGIFNPTSKFRPYLGVGLEFTGYNFTAGMGISHLEQGPKTATPYKVPRHYFAYAKYSWDISEKFNLTPALFVRSSVFITQAELNVMASINKRVSVGALYRSTDDAGVILGVYITKQLFLSYSYDFDFGELRKYNTGSHELNIMYRINGIKEKKVFYKSGRYVN